MDNKKLIRTLKNATVTCRGCGEKYGVYSVGCSSIWNGVCHVCGKEGPVTETRDFGYFITGIRSLILEDMING
jgi:hypothetical protein